ncbi:hypothetical protein P4O66_010416 [Electrophorus voltai]|uniref:SEA domain-containing protein n=1 Tax=Electrophorus voltai TaxID=2609070 RepID=A0AAD8Z9P6_9TELE|nr:hypothetical protein P4O66_010416 [Electrophorus voltai]
MLDLNVSYTKGAKPNVATIPMILEQNTVPTPSSHFNTSQLLNTSTHVTITNATTTHLTIANASTSHTTITNASATHTTITNASATHTTITNASTSHTTITSASTSHTTITSASTTSNSKFRESPTTTLGITTSQSTTRDHNTPKTSHTPISDKTTLTSDNMTVPPHNLTSLTSTTIPSSRPTSPASPAEPNRVAPSEHMAPASAAAGAAEAEQGVPGWGIALLVLAAFILFLFLVLLILLLLCWCCCWRTRGFVNMSDPTPIGYYNPDIPMYSTHSTYDSHNGTPLVFNKLTSKPSLGFSKVKMITCQNLDQIYGIASVGCNCGEVTVHPLVHFPISSTSHMQHTSTNAVQVQASLAAVTEHHFPPACIGPSLCLGGLPAET